MKKIKFFTILFVALLLFNSCKKDSDKNFDIKEFYGTYSQAWNCGSGAGTGSEIIISAGTNSNEIIMDVYGLGRRCIDNITNYTCSPNGKKITFSDSGYDNDYELNWTANGSGEYNSDNETITMNIEYELGVGEPNHDDYCKQSCTYTLTKK